MRVDELARPTSEGLCKMLIGRLAAGRPGLGSSSLGAQCRWHRYAGQESADPHTAQCLADTLHSLLLLATGQLQDHLAPGEQHQASVRACKPSLQVQGGLPVHVCTRLGQHQAHELPPVVGSSLHTKLQSASQLPAQL